MEELYSLLHGQRNMAPTMLSTKQLSAIIPHQLMNPQNIGSSSMNNLASFSSKKLSHTSPELQKIVDEKYIEESLIPSKLFLHKHVPNAMYMSWDENDDRKQHGGRRNLNKIIRGNNKSIYLGVIICNQQRFEAYVRDNSDPGKRGRTVYVGGYYTEADAARAHDLVSMKIGGLKALTNFPVSYYSNEMDEMIGISTKDYISAIRCRGKDYGDGDSPYRGVYRNKVPIPGVSKNWEARLGREESQNMHLGTYYTAEDAARAFDIISIKIKGRDAITNFDLNSYEVDGIMRCEVTRARDGTFVLKREGTSHDGTLPQSMSMVQHINPQTHNLISTNPYALGGAGSSGSTSIVNHAAQFPNQLNATMQPPLQTRQTLLNVNNGFNQNLLINNNNNQLQLPQGSNRIVLPHGHQNCVGFPNWPSDFGKKLLGRNFELLEPLSNTNNVLNVQPLAQVMVNGSTTGATNNGVSSFEKQIQPVEPSNKEVAATPLLLPAPNQSSEPHNIQANNTTLNQISHDQNSNSSSLSDSFQAPVSEPMDLDMRDYLNRSYIEDNDFACDFDMFGAMNIGGRQGL